MLPPLATLLLLPALVWPGDPGDEADLIHLSLEELMELPVGVASRGAQPLQDAAAAVYVLTGDEIRRAGFTSIPEALRMVPGFQVARYNSHSWDLTARGFSGGFANDLLVMIDGIEVYTPLFAGVWWHLQELPIEDVERIEVVRGPVAALWGANAVNGIVHVITKSAADTQGSLTSLHVGDEERRVLYRYGDAWGERGHWRAWGLATDHDPLVDATGEPLAEGDWGMVRGGFRGDWTSKAGDRFALIANAYSASIGEDYFVAFPAPPYLTFVEDSTPKNGLQVLGSWESGDADDTTRWQAWYTRDHQKQVDFSIQIDSFEVQYQRALRLGARNRMVYGLGWRLDVSELEGDFTYTFDPERRTKDTLRAFVQDELSFPGADLRLVAGASVEHNDFTGVEFQPTLRAIWQPTPQQAVWAAVSRAVRTPSLEESDVRFNIPIDLMGNFLQLQGSGDLDAEELLAYELGWRFRPTSRLAVDLSGFVNHYDDLQTLEDGTPFAQGGNTFFPLVYANLAEADSWGVELALDYVVSERWKLRSAYTYFEIDSDVDDDSTDVFFTQTDGSTPHNQANLRSYFDLNDVWQLDAGLYYVDRRPLFDTDSYLRGDLRVGCNPSPGVRVSFGVQNAFEELHREADPGVYVERSAYFSISVQR